MSGEGVVTKAARNHIIIIIIIIIIMVSFSVVRGQWGAWIKVFFFACYCVQTFHALHGMMGVALGSAGVAVTTTNSCGDIGGVARV